jgi:drug/metabolite transporter (DMT)-like permease
MLHPLRLVDTVKTIFQPLACILISMNWITYSLVMFAGSVALYLTVRKSSLESVPTRLTNLAMFAVPLVAFLLLGASSHQTYALTGLNWLILVIAATIFAYGGNTVSLRAIDIAPNPGYSLVLSKSYVLFTTLVAVTLLGAELTLRKLIAILLIVAFSAVVMINPSVAKRASGNGWVPLSFGAFFAWGLLSISSKYLFSHGVGTIPFLMYLYAIVTACIVVAQKIRLSSFKNLSSQAWLLLLGTGIFSTVFNLGQFEAISLAPNIGYVNAVNAASISLVTVLAVVMFKDELTKRKALGVMGVTAGLLLLLL